MIPRKTALLLLAVLFAATSVLAASPDGNVEWGGLSHLPDLDTRPLCPLSGETFSARFQAYANDLTAARLHVDDGAVVWVDAAVVGTRGPYQVWEAQVPATAADQLSYWFELSDGADVDYLSVSGVSDAQPTDGGFAVDYMSLIHAPVGATPAAGGVVFKVWSPSRTICHVRGEFNGWSTADPMTKVGEHFVRFVPGAAAGDEYKFYFQNSHWNTDARAKAMDPGSNNNSIVVDPLAYDWQVEDFTVPELGELAIYQIHVGTFSGRNDPYGAASFPARFADVAARAEHLAELGINAVMLNPVTEFPGDHSAGYNPISAWAMEWIYGTPDDFKAMVDALHARGIAVLLDIVWNHFSFNDNYLWYYDGTQIYFDDPAVETPWGSQADFDRDAVRSYFVESARMWLGEYRVDGFRMDATSYMNVPPQEGSGWSLMQALNDEMDRRWADKVAIAEQLPDNDWVTRPTSAGGAGFDSQYHDAFTDRLREELFDAASGDPEIWKIANIVNGSGAWLQGVRATNYLELHDEAWPSSGGQRIVKSIDTTAPHDDEWAQGRVKLAQGLVFTAPGVPAMLMGCEWLEDTDFGTDLENRIDWSKKITYAGTFEFFSDLISLRTTLPALRADAGWSVFHQNESGNVIAFRRGVGDDQLVVIASFDNGDYGSYRIGLPHAGDWEELINSQALAYDGNGMENPGTLTAESIPADGYAQSIAIALPRMGLIILGPERGTAVPADAALPARIRMLGASPNPFNPRTTLSFELPTPGSAKLEIFDVAGRRVAILVNGTMSAGRHDLTWDGLDDSGRPVSSGLYLARVESAGGSDRAKLVLLR